MLAHKARRASGAGGATIATAGTYSTDGNATNYTSGSISIGTPGDDRFIIAAIGLSAGGRTVSTCTVDGESLSLAKRQQGSFTTVEIWAGYVNTGNSSGVVAITTSGSNQRCRIQLMECHFIQSATATATDGDTTDNTALTAAVSAGGVALGAAWSDAITTFGWTGDLTDHGDLSGAENGTLSCASDAYAGAGTATGTPDAATATDFCSALATFA